MGKPLAGQALIGASAKKVPFLHKLDMYGSFILLLMLWFVPFLYTGVSNNHVNILVPHEMLMHSPFLVNNSGTGLNDRLICNPHFETFISNATYSDGFKGEIVTQGKSDEFLALPEVEQSLQHLLNTSNNYTRTYFVISLDMLCELVWPNLDTGGCLSYPQMQQCLPDGECGSNPNLCWWRKISTIKLIVYAHAFTFLPALAVLCLLMYDPPPAKLKKITKPIITAVLFCASGICMFVYVIALEMEVSKYLQHPGFYETFPDPIGFWYGYGSAWVCLVVEGTFSFFFGLCYFYGAFFTPAYPRHRSRVEHRRGYYQQQLKNLRRDAGLEI